MKICSIFDTHSTPPIMKQYILILVAFVGFKATAQTLHPTVIATSGTSFNDGTNQLDWTMGETVTSTLTSGSDMLTQGFHQPDLLITAIENPTETVMVNIFPNPTASTIQVQLQDITNATTIELYSNDGKLITSQKITSTATQIDMSSYAAGTYLLSIKNKNASNNTYQIIKSK